MYARATMEPTVGRYLEGRMLETVNLIKTVYDIGLGQGKDVNVWIDGLELVFGRKEPGEGGGFLRILPHEVNITLAFPRGHEIPDPQKRTKGVHGSRKSMLVRHIGDLDPYTRRMVDAAYALGKD